MDPFTFNLNAATLVLITKNIDSIFWVFKYYTYNIKQHFYGALISFLSNLGPWSFTFIVSYWWANWSNGIASYSSTCSKKSISYINLSAFEWMKNHKLTRWIIENSNSGRCIWKFFCLSCCIKVMTLWNSSMISWDLSIFSFYDIYHFYDITRFGLKR